MPVKNLSSAAFCTSLFCAPRTWATNWRLATAHGGTLIPGSVKGRVTCDGSWFENPDVEIVEKMQDACVCKAHNEGPDKWVYWCGTHARMATLRSLDSTPSNSEARLKTCHVRPGLPSTFVTSTPALTAPRWRPRVHPCTPTSRATVPPLRRQSRKSESTLWGSRRFRTACPTR